MKKTIYSILFVASVLASSSCMKVDNFDAPEAHVTGRIIDSTTGENILADQSPYLGEKFQPESCKSGYSCETRWYI